ncbi:MAG: hypothetical protein P4N60_16340 [Verrucomicrobiae bacterium]|nr:hypothetical protein [Verrucomicrobiae bacterium]
MHRSPSPKLFNGDWLSGCTRLLVGRRGGFQALVWAAAINFLLFGLFLAGTTPLYETNDDLMMQLIASGFHTGHPDGHLVFTNILIGWALQFLYGTWAGCNWYFIYLVVVHYAALTAIAFLVVSRRGGWLFTGLYVGFFLIVEMRILLHLQFTTTAFLAGTAGLLLLVDGLQPAQPARWPKVITGFAFAGVMCLVREPVAMLFLIIAFPFILERLGLTQWRRLLGTGLAFAFIFTVLHGLNRWAYQRDPAWAEFTGYNQMRGEIHVTALEKFIPQAAPAVGWSTNDGWMFSKFYFSEPDVYAGAPKMRLLLARLKTLARDEPASAWKFSASFLYLPTILWRDAGLLMKLALLNAIWCVVAAGVFRRRCLVTLLISYGVFVVFCFYLFMTARLPERVSYNIPLFIHAICLYWATGFPNWPAARIRPGWRAQTLRLAALVLVPIWAALYLSVLSDLARSLWWANTSNRNLEHISRKILQPIRAGLPAQKPPVLIAIPLDSVLEQCLFFYPTAAQVPFSLVPYGWITHSPIFTQILERHHLRPYSLSLVDRPDIYFMMEPGWLEPLKVFYREHYGLEVRFDMVLNTDEMPPFADCRLHLYQAHVVGDQATAP